MRVCMCMCNSSMWKEIHGATLQSISKMSFPLHVLYVLEHALSVCAHVHIQYSYVRPLFSVHRSSRKAATVSLFDSKEICSK